MARTHETKTVSIAVQSSRATFAATSSGFVVAIEQLVATVPPGSL